LTMSELGLSLEELAGQPLELFARDGAKLLLTVALEEEVTTACETLARHPEEYTTFYRFHERYRRHIRTSNIIERPFKEVKRRTRVVGRFPNETSALVMVLSLLEEERMKWQKVRMKAEDIVWVEEASKALEQEPISLEFLEKALVF
jgi:transposase-like protein